MLSSELRCCCRRHRRRHSKPTPTTTLQPTTSEPTPSPLPSLLPIQPLPGQWLLPCAFGLSQKQEKHAHACKESAQHHATHDCSTAKCARHHACACARTCTYMHLGPWQTTIIAVAPQPALPAQASPRTTTYASYYLRSMHQASSLEEKQDKEVNNNPGDPRAGHRRPKPHSDPPRSATWRRFHI